MAIITPLMRKFMYNDEELDVLTGQAHSLFTQHKHEKVSNNREFFHPTPKNKLSLSFQYRGLHPHDNKIEVSPEKRKPLHMPGRNSICWQKQTQPGDDSGAPHDFDDLHDDFDYRFDLVGGEDDGDAALDEAQRLFGEPPGRFDSKGRYILYRPESASSPPLPARDATLSYTKPPSSSTRSTRGGSPGAGRGRSRFAQSLDSSLHPLPWGFGARSLASQRPYSATSGEALGGASIMFGSPSSRDASLPSIPSAAPAPASRGNPSAKFMRNRRIKREAESTALYTQVFQEAALMQRKFVACVREANVFAQSLGRRIVYRVIERDPLEDAAWETILQGNNPRLSGAAIPPGTGKRIEKTLVEVTEEGRDVRYLGTTHFFREHSRLQIEVNRLLSVRPKVPISDPEEEEARIRAAAMAAEEAAAAGHRDHHANPKPAYGLPPPLHASTPATAGSPSLRPPRAVIEAKLHEVLLLETEKVLRLKAQLKHLDSLGWNQSLEAVRATLGTPY